MIGARAFLIDMAPLIIWLVIWLAIVAVVLRAKKRGPDTLQASTAKMRLRGTIAIIVLVVGLVAGPVRHFRQMQNWSTLHNLAADSVDFIQVGATRLAKASDAKALVDALRSCQWYVPTAGDGGWAQAVSLVVHLKSGNDLRYRVGRMLKQEGVAIDFISQDPNSHFEGHYGYVWVKGLPQVLDRVGAPLPTERKGS